eukprot:SAG31_NODE_5219_length_2669_cov_1.862646_3_plen_55_part_00
MTSIDPLPATCGEHSEALPGEAAAGCPETMKTGTALIGAVLNLSQTQAIALVPV